jgi:hypothetical protein
MATPDLFLFALRLENEKFLKYALKEAIFREKILLKPRIIETMLKLF